MRNKDFKSIEVIKLPELQVSQIWKKLINWVSHIRYIYWVAAIITSLVLFLLWLPDYMWSYIWPRIKAQGVIISLVLVFCIVSVSLIWKTGQKIDVWVFMVFNMRGQRPCWVDWTMLGLTQIGNGIFAFALALIYFLSNQHLFAYEIVLGTLTLWLGVELMKILIKRTRPYNKLKNIRIIGERAGGHSFPSGHTSQSFFMATLLLQHYQFGLTGAIALYAIALVIGITRIYVGMHYPRDVLGGAMFGTAWGLLGVLVNGYIPYLF